MLDRGLAFLIAGSSAPTGTARAAVPLAAVYPAADYAVNAGDMDCGFVLDEQLAPLPVGAAVVLQRYSSRS